MNNLFIEILWKSVKDENIDLKACSTMTDEKKDLASLFYVLQ
jgi:hypothetical protein